MPAQIRQSAQLVLERGAQAAHCAGLHSPNPSPDITSRLATTGQLVVRSGIEIARLLDSMLRDGDAVTANLPSQQLFLSQLLYVEPVRGYFLLTYTDRKLANSAALAARSLTLRCNHRGAQFAFTANGPRQAAHAGQPCIQCGLPTAILGMQQRRANARLLVPAEAPVVCDLRMGLQAFAARVADVSLDGICMLVSDPGIPLCAGTRLERARIRHPQCEPFHVDLVVRHVTRIVLPNGERASRIGCAFVGAREDLENLIRLFIIDVA